MLTLCLFVFLLFSQQTATVSEALRRVVAALGKNQFRFSTPCLNSQRVFPKDLSLVFHSTRLH